MLSSVWHKKPASYQSRASAETWVIFVTKRGGCQTVCFHLFSRDPFTNLFECWGEVNNHEYKAQLRMESEWSLTGKVVETTQMISIDLLFAGRMGKECGGAHPKDMINWSLLLTTKNDYHLWVLRSWTSARSQIVGTNTMTERNQLDAIDGSQPAGMPWSVSARSKLSDSQCSHTLTSTALGNLKQLGAWRKVFFLRMF